jgi:alpha-L-fucosidase 2
MVRQLFLNCIAATKVLNCDVGLREQMQKAIAQLPPTIVSPRDGEIQEYLNPAYAVTGRSGCQLLSHWGLIWCDQVTPRKTPELAAAMRKAYEAPDRRPWVTGQVGSWQGAFPANTFARLGDGDRVAEILAKHFRWIVQDDFIAGFIQSEWEIDGNLGTMAAIGEMLLQSQTGEIELLPALPKSWLSGKVTGLKARGGFTVDIEWKDGKVTNYRISAKERQQVKVRVNGELKTVTAEKAI